MFLRIELKNRLASVIACEVANLWDEANEFG